MCYSNPLDGTTKQYSKKDKSTLTYYSSLFSFCNFKKCPTCTIILTYTIIIILRNASMYCYFELYYYCNSKKCQHVLLFNNVIMIKF